jgi:diguanylate cyclase (GGDEF)-like protein
VRALREQVEDLRRTAADLVRADDLDALLKGIASRAGTAVRGQRHLLAIRLPGEVTPRVIGDGFDDAEAARLGAALLDGRLEDAEEWLVSDVASTEHRYGRLAAALPAGTGFLEGEQTLLDAYSDLAAAALDTAAALAAARRRGARATALLHLARVLAAVRDEDAMAAAVADAVRPVLDADRASVNLWDAEEQALVPRAAVGYPDALLPEALAWRARRSDTPALDALLDHPAPQLHTMGTTDPFVRASLEQFGHAAVGVAPVVVAGQLAGTIHAGWSQEPPGAATDGLLDALGSLADHAGLVLANLRMLAEARHAATHDPLTGLPSRELFTAQVDSAVARAVRRGEEVAVCFLDLDGFKGVNDAHGHAAGDEVLVAVGERLRALVRDADGTARLSGDEFAVLLVDVADRRDVGLVAARIVDALCAPYPVAGATAEIGVSIGIALTGTPESAESLLRRADTAMYEAKAIRGTYRFAAPPVTPDEGSGRG